MFMGLNNSSNIDNFLFFVSKELIIYIYIFKIYTVGYNINGLQIIEKKCLKIIKMRCRE